MKKILYILIILPLFCFFIAMPASAADTEEKTWNMPELQVPIPDLAFSQEVKCDDVDAATGAGTNCQVPWIWEYIAAIYKYGVGIAGIVAVIVMMIGGFLWITAGGNATTVENAKSYINGSLTGLVLVLFSYVILYNLNPKLVQKQYVVLGDVKEINAEALYSCTSCGSGGGYMTGSLSTYNTSIYDDTITKAANKYKIDPALLKGLIKQESGFNPNAVSPRGAMGLVQFMPATAKEVGVTDRSDPTQSIYGAARYLDWIRGQLGSQATTENILAAYNGGIGTVKNYLNGTGSLKSETQNYVVRVKTYQAQYSAKL